MARSRNSFPDWLRHHRRWMTSAIVAFWALVFLAPYLIVQHWPARVEMLTPFLSIDHFYADGLARIGRRTEPNPDLVFLGIDEASQQLDGLDPAEVAGNHPLALMHREWPWPREVYADLLDRLADNGARVVIIDILFGASKPDDGLLAASLDRHKNMVVISANFADLQNSQLELPSPSLVPMETAPDPRVGFVNFWPDLGGVIRRTTLRQPFNAPALGRAQTGEKISSLAATAAKIFNPALSIPSDERGHVFRYTGPSGCFSTASVYEVFDPHSWHFNFKDGAFFKGKIVMIGPLGNFHQDQHETPLGKMDGAEVHLQALNAILHHEFLTYTGDAFSTILALTFFTSLVAWLVGVLSHRAVTSGIVAVLFGAAYLASGLPLFSGGIVLAVAAPFGAFLGSTVTGLGAHYILEQRERSRTRRFFERYVSPAVVREILDNPSGYYESLVGRRREVTVLFSDLRGFTSMTEAADSEQLVRELNEYLQEMTRALFAHQGILDKFIGDAVMAVWGSFAPYPREDSKRAVRAALAMREALAALNLRRASRGQDEFAMGIGIHHGEAVVGDIGAEDQKNFTVIGDTVNLASRLEGLTKEYGVELIISETVEQLVRDEFHLQTVDFVRVKGRAKSIQVYAVLGPGKVDLAADRNECLRRYEAGMTAYRARDFTRARAHFAACCEIYPKDQLGRLFLGRCEEYEKNPPPENWDGSYTMTRK